MKKTYKIIAFYPLDESTQEDGFYLHQDDKLVNEYENDDAWESEVIGTTEQTADEFTGI